MSTPAKRCPFCASTNTEKLSDFGTSVMTGQFYCLQCRSAFEYIKWGDKEARLDVPEFLRNSDSGK